MVVQRKPKTPVQFELTKPTRESLIARRVLHGGAMNEYVFPSRVARDDHISTRQYSRLVGKWVGATGLSAAAYGTDSLRRTKVAMIYISAPAICASCSSCSATPLRRTGRRHGRGILYRAHDPSPPQSRSAASVLPLWLSHWQPHPCILADHVSKERRASCVE